MWRIIITSLFAIALASTAAWAEIERNPHSRSDLGVDEQGQDLQVHLVDLPADAATVAISLTARNAVALAVTDAIRRTAGRLLMAEQVPPDSEPAAAAPVEAETAPEPSAILETVEALQDEDAVLLPADEPAVVDAAAPPVADAPEPEAAEEAPQEPVVAEPATTEPEPQPVVTLDDLADALSNRTETDQPDVVIDTEPVVDDQAQLSLTETEHAEEPGEAAAGQPEAAETTIAEIEEQEPAADETDALLHYDGANDKRRPDLTQNIKDYDGHENVSVNPSVDDQLLLAEEAADSQDDDPETGGEDEAGDTGDAESAESAGQMEKDSGTSGWVRAAPAGRARPVAPSRRWNRRHDLPKLRPPETGEPIQQIDIPELEIDEAELPADIGIAEPEPAPAVAFMDSPSLVRGLVLAPADGDADSRMSAMAPVEPVINDWPPRMSDYDISDRIRTVTRGNSRQKKIALTFDDGPHPEFTSQLLAVLDYYDVKATFFFVGVQAQKYPHWVKMVDQAGHEIGSHTYDHFRLPKMPRDEKIYQIDEYQRLIEGLTGVTPRFLRPPGGQVDAETEELLAERGMVLAMWDVALNDTHDDKTSKMILQTANRNIRSGSVVLVHDGIQATVDMLPELITQLQAQGFEFVTMSELAAGL